MVTGAAPLAAAADDEEEFEEFEAGQWGVAATEDASLWETAAEWDAEEVDTEFAAKFQAEMEKMEAEKAANPPKSPPKSPSRDASKSPAI